MAKKERLEQKKEADVAKDVKNKAQKEAIAEKDWSSGAKDSNKKVEEERKRLEVIAKKQEREAMLALEESQNATVKKQPATAMRSSKPLMLSNLTALSSTASSNPYADVPTQAFTATNIDDALSLLDLASTDAQTTNNLAGIDRHPERRAKSAFAAFEERESAILREENKGLRLSQVKQAIAKLWKKSPENPMNQEKLAYNATREEEREFLERRKEDALDRLRDN